MLNSPVFRIWLIPMVVIMAGLAIACNNGAIATAPAAPASSTTAALAPATAYPTYTPYPTYTLYPTPAPVISTSMPSSTSWNA